MTTPTKPSVAPQASLTYIEATGQMEYRFEWFGGPDIWMSGVNLNDGTKWASPNPVHKPERWAPVPTTPAEFFGWAANAIR